MWFGLGAFFSQIGKRNFQAQKLKKKIEDISSEVLLGVKGKCSFQRAQGNSAAPSSDPHTYVSIAENASTYLQN